MRNALTLSEYLDDMFRDLNRFAVGFEPTLRNLDYARNTSTQGFPPYDLEQTDENTYKLTMAVAGYAAEDITMTQQGEMLTIEGTARKSEGNFLFKGIAGRGFRRTFMLDAYVAVTSTALNNGMLEVTFTKEIPDALKPRQIPIGLGQPQVIEGTTTGK